MANKQSLKSLRIKEFRGSTRDFSISFDGKKPLSLIYGENGTGKTTICDAFDFVGNAKVGSLENRGLGTLQPFWPTIGKARTDILVELTVDSITWKAQASTKSVSLSPSTPLPRIEVLRRSTVLKLVQDAPSEKYGAIKPFIDISVVEQAETVLRALICDKRLAESEAVSRIAENSDSLERLRQQSNATLIDAIEWAKSEIATPPVDQTQDIESYRAAIRGVEAVIAIENEVANSIFDLETALSNLRNANDTLGNATANAYSSDGQLIGILQAAKSHYINHAEGDICPLCESADKATGLVKRIDERLSKLTELEAARSNVASVNSIVESKRTLRHASQEKVKNLARVAADKLEATNSDLKTPAELVAHQLIHAASTGTLNDVDFNGLRDLVEIANQLCTAMDGKAAAYKTIKALYEQYDANNTRLTQVSRVIPKLEQALAICETQRKKFLDGILSSIAQEVGRIYEVIHPGEGLNKISLKLDPKKTGSLDLSAEFLNKQDQPPHAYFSESHLDTLGLCIFLALAGRQSPHDTIVVMDDVLGSIDEPHVDRLIEMLYKESQRFKHTIITTHYRPWKEKFRWGWLRSGQVELIELKAWESTTGIQVAGLTQAPLIELRNHLTQQPISTQAACASAGVLLEAICDYLTALYECAVPRRKGKPTLGDLLPNINGKLRDALRVEVIQDDGSYLSILLNDKFDQLQQMAQLRNIFGCHYNDLALQLPGQDAVQFATTVHEIASALICDEQGWPGSDKSGSYWATKEETRRLHPLKKPSK